MSNEHNIIYLVTSPSGKHYIGITAKGLSRRMREHSYEASKGSSYLIHKAIRKYGDRLTWEHFATAFSWKAACELEKRLIEDFASHVTECGYNMTRGGEGNAGLIMSMESRRRISASKLGQMAGNKHHMYGKHHTAESKLKISAAKLGKRSWSTAIKDSNGNIYAAVIDAAIALSLKRTAITEALRLGRRLKNGLSFTYVEKKAC